MEDGKQLIKASGSVGGNYVEANEALGKKDFLMRIRISRKEAKESAYWLRLINETNSLTNTDEAQSLIQEANELKKSSHPYWRNRNELNSRYQSVWVIDYLNLKFVCNLRFEI